MIYLTTEEHRKVVERLVFLHSSVTNVDLHPAGAEYTSLMVCFGLHSRGVAESTLTLHDRFGTEWFPTTACYVMLRSLFEVDVTAHYIAKDPANRSRMYVDFEKVTDKKMLDAINRHRMSQEPTWREGLQLLYEHAYASRQAEIEASYAGVRRQFEDKNGRMARSWSGKSLYTMAKEVNHLEAYEIYYAELSSFAHVNVALADRFLRVKGLAGRGGPAWSMRAREFDVAHAFRYAAIFFTCFLELFGNELKLWDALKVRACWDFPEAKNRDPGYA